MATLPRVLSLAEDGTLRIEPVPELEVLRFKLRGRENVSIAANAELKLDDVRGDCLEILAVIAPGDAREFGIKVRCSPDLTEETPIVCAPQAKTLRTELAKSSLNPDVKYAAMTAQWAKDHQIAIDQRFTTEQVAPFELKPGEPLRLRIFLDRSVLEIFANERQCLTQRIYPTRPDSLGITLFARGGRVTVHSLEAWQMSPTNSW